MTEHSSPRFEITKESAVKRFLALNRDRLRRVHGSLTPRQQNFLDALPLLFHTNHPLLPGYVAKDTVFGIAEYSPSPSSVRAVRQLCRSFNYDRRSPPRMALRGLYMMGSPGTIAYSSTSDLDMWLVHAPEIGGPALEQLNEKARRIETFSASLGLEVHFFILDAERFRDGETLTLSDESSGTSQLSLLLDEFYRSSLLVAGLPPLWWRVPARYDKDYSDYVDAAVARGVIDRTDYIDFGALPTIPADEFFGAAVWHLYKSIHSPYKSVLKLLLMETYAAQYRDIRLLSTRYKSNIEANEADLNALDPYILMYTQVEEYLREAQDSVRLEVLRRCFYIKANLALSSTANHHRDDWRVEVIESMVSSWGWTDNQVKRLDQRADWGLEIAIEERRDLSSTLNRSYALVSHFAKEHASESKISRNDLHVLGRKLYSAFEKQSSKIDIITGGICANPVEPSLSLHEVQVEKDNFIWLLFSGAVTPTEGAFQQPIRRSGSAAEIVQWCHLNRLADRATNWHGFPGHSRLNQSALKRVHEMVTEALEAAPAETTADDAGTRPHIARIALLVNVGIDPFADALAGGDVLTSDHNDPFAYGGLAVNLIRSIDLMFVTSWHEAFAFRYTGPSAVLDALAECLQWIVAERAEQEMPTVVSRCFSPDGASLISERVAGVFSETLAAMAKAWRRSTPHFIMQCDEQMHHLKLVKGCPQIVHHANQAQLMRALADAEADCEQRIRFDDGCARAGVLPNIYRRNRTGVVQICAQQRGSRADVYILDERGVLLVDRQECWEMKSLLQHYRSFLEAALPRCQMSRELGATPEVETLEVVASDGRIQFKTFPTEQLNRQPLTLNVLADADSNGHQQFTITVSDREFSTWEHAGSLFVQVAEFVLGQRTQGAIYPIYITDLDLSTRFRQVTGLHALNAYNLLRYKKRIEEQLMRALLSDTVVRAAAAGVAS
jgi:adenylate cyclase class 1